MVTALTRAYGEVAHTTDAGAGIVRLRGGARAEGWPQVWGPPREWALQRQDRGRARAPPHGETGIVPG